MQKKYFIVDNYYFDFDTYNQLRIAGPGNHLFLGWSFPEDLKVVLEEYSVNDDKLTLKLRIPQSQLEMHCPIITDMRSIRNAIEAKYPRVSYKDLVDEERNDLFPEIIDIDRKDFKTEIILKNVYKDIYDNYSEYGIKIIVDDIYVDFSNDYLKFTGDKEILLTIETLTNITSTSNITTLFIPKKPLDNEGFSEFLISLYDESAYFIEHLIKNNKTSSFEFGTIFPRDWMESADLGSEDFSKEIIDYIYEKVLENVSEEGEGWHENVTGQLKTKISEPEQIDRKMIDIEPHYILGLKYVSPQFILDQNNSQKLKKVANYIVRQAEQNDYISFKKYGEDYYIVGNWRDSGAAFPLQKPPVSPYDVNCVFYPEALRIIQEYNALFNFNEKLLDDLIEKWQRQKDKYRLFHPYNITGYSLALHGVKNKPIPISNLDESYDLFYGRPSFNEVDSFAKKIMSKSYFYTPVGPLLVASDEEDFSTYHYHGKVIWPKQAAFAVGGLTRQYKRGIAESWPSEIVDQIRTAIIKTCEACFNGWEMLGFVPELYYYDEKLDRARLYTDQERYEAQASNIQLWSSVAVRRIVSDYDYIINE